MRWLEGSRLVAGSLLLVLVARGEAQPAANPDLVRLQASLRPLFLEHYPQATSELKGDQWQVEFDTRAFLIHRALMTGEWQEAMEVRGPNRGGILCNVQLQPGVYNGQAVLPQTFDEHYFRTLVLQVPSPRRDAYLYIHLSYPDSVDREFLGAFTRALDAFWKSGK